MYNSLPLRHRPFQLIFFAIVVAIGTSGCDALCPPANVSFATCIAPTLRANCSGDGCHGGKIPAFGLPLDADFYLHITTKNATGKPMPLIQSGNPENSYLLLKLLKDTSISGERMPLRRPLLSQPQIEMIRAWINEGAKNN